MSDVQLPTNANVWFWSSGNKFDDEWGVDGSSFIRHSVPGLLSMANSGRNTK